MASFFFTFREYIKYRFRARNAHSLHSPFLYQLYCEVLNKKDRAQEKQLLLLRRSFTDKKDTVSFHDPKTGKKITTTISKLVRSVASGHRFSFFLIRLINYLKVDAVMETGTSTGLNACYLALSNAKKVITIEGAKHLAARTSEVFRELNLQNVEMIAGNVRDVFEEAVERHRPDLIFLDADHRSETIQFYLDVIKKKSRVTCIVIHDIYWSSDMKKAWEKCVQSKDYNLTVDIFQAGLIFPHYPIEKQHFSVIF